MPWSISDVPDAANTIYDEGLHPWSSLFNGLPSSDVYRPSPRQQALIAQAVQTADPDTPAWLIRQTMTVPPPADDGPARPQPTIEGVLDGSALQPPHLYDRSASDFSGTPAGMESSSTPAIPVW